jgi:hypothetical protein
LVLGFGFGFWVGFDLRLGQVNKERSKNKQAEEIKAGYN